MSLIYEYSTGDAFNEAKDVRTTKPTDPPFLTPKLVAQVQGVDIRYHGHEFDEAVGNDYDYASGIRVEAGGLYTGNDFEDVSRAELFIEGAYFTCSSLKDVELTLILSYHLHVLL